MGTRFHTLSPSGLPISGVGGGFILLLKGLVWQKGKKTGAEVTPINEVEYREIAGHPDHRVGADGSVQRQVRGQWVPLKSSDLHGARGVTLRRGWRTVYVRDLLQQAFGLP